MSKSVFCACMLGNSSRWANRVLTAPDARTAHDIRPREPPDLRVVDIRLPDQMACR
jgi:DNA-binding response OmpR family regulator